MLAVLALALAADQPRTPANLTDVFAGACDEDGAKGVMGKPAQTLVIGFVQGYLEGTAVACDHGATLAFCGTLQSGKVDGTPWLPSNIAAAASRLCHAHPQRSIRAIGQRILVDTGARPRGK